MSKLFSKYVSLILTILLLMTTILVATTETGYAASGTTYYIDSVNGNDSNNGTSTSTPWKTLTKVNSITFQPGDNILFKSGCFWTGMLAPKGSGNSSAQITIGKYGTGPNPIIDGAGELAAIKLAGQEYWTIQYMDVKNTNPDPTKDCNGILLDTIAEGPSIIHKMYIQNCKVYDVYCKKNNGLGNAGILVRFHDLSGTLPRYDDLRIENNYIHNIYSSGLVMFGVDSSNYKHNPSAWSTNVLIKNNTIDSTGNNGALIGLSKNPVIEYNIVGNSGTTNTTGYLAGLWSYNCENALFQFNEVYGTKLFMHADGTAFDTDWGNRGTVIHQYNYSHDNEGGFKIGPFDGNAPYNCPDLVADIIRYNISQNDHNRDATFQVGSGKVFAYNNVFYNPNHRIYIKSRNDVAGNKVYNNIFVGNSGNYTTAATYSNNCYYGNNGPSSDINKITANPQFINPGSGGMGIDSVSGYKLAATSPCLNSGIPIADNGGRDYWWNELYSGNPDIGAYEAQTPAEEDSARIEAESGAVGGGAVVVNNSSASDGQCIGSLHLNGAHNQISGVDGGTSGGSYILTISYATADSGATKGLYVNGAKVATLSFPNTGGWNTYDSISKQITLNSGTSNTIKIINDGNTAQGVDIDYYILSRKVEAESGIVGGGAAVMNNSSASDGRCIGSLHLNGAHNQISGIDGGALGGSYTLTISYATADSGATKGLYVNGAKVATLVFPSTGGWSTFGSISQQITLNSGTSNTIKVINDSNTGQGVDIDCYNIK